MGSPSRFTNGISTRLRSHPLALMKQADPTRYLTFFDDFLKYTATDWVYHASAGSPTKAVSATEPYGALVLTNSAADNDDVYQQTSNDGGTTAATIFTPVAGKALFYQTRAKFNDGSAGTTELDAQFGLGVTDTSPIATPSSGLTFTSTDGTAGFRGRVGGGTATYVTNYSTLIAGNTYGLFTIVYNGKISLNANDHAIFWYLNSTLLGSTVSQNLTPYALAPCMALRNGQAVASSVMVDYYFAAMER